MNENKCLVVVECLGRQRNRNESGKPDSKAKENRIISPFKPVASIKYLIDICLLKREKTLFNSETRGSQYILAKE